MKNEFLSVQSPCYFLAISVLYLCCFPAISPQNMIPFYAISVQFSRCFLVVSSQKLVFRSCWERIPIHPSGTTRPSCADIYTQGK